MASWSWPLRWLGAAWWIAAGAAVIAAAVLAWSPVWADEGRDHDHDRARAALQAGEVLPLGQVMDQVRRRYPGELLEVELERERGRWIYELKLLQPGGVLVRLYVDAKTAEVLKSRARGADHD
ncbi:PepSY domain-containing protein [Ideonella sp. DXS29W]|uniref:PepSY domain-containing protein n=1 Tax=Ideonella lacteola TaxID=2984193 RepID=A0ABU9BUW0_9BURK